MASMDSGSNVAMTSRQSPWWITLVLRASASHATRCGHGACADHTSRRPLADRLSGSTGGGSTVGVDDGECALAPLTLLLAVSERALNRGQRSRGVVDVDTYVGGIPEPEPVVDVLAIPRRIEDDDGAPRRRELEQGRRVVADVDVSPPADLV